MTALAAAFLTMQVARGPAESPPFVPGEVLVRFRTDTAGRAASGEAAPRSEVETFLKAVSREVERPLRLLRPASGGEVLLAIDASELRERLERKLAAVPGVVSVAARPPVEGRPSAALEVRLGPATRADDVAGRAARELDLPVVVGEGSEGRDPVIEVDMRAITKDVVERLKRRPDVEYAQPNFSLRPTPERRR